MSDSLEEERQKILDRMQASREQYRRMLLNQPEVVVNRQHPVGHHAAYALPPKAMMPRNSALRWMAQHPVVCAAAVAALIAVGPKRIARAAAQGSNAATNLTLRNPSNIDAITRLITLVADIVQRMPSRYPPA
ncbi:hypothetical protein [Noviherbaspirillum galbum]|uniref:Uncharacterized protein n=1 Tax=Noviherbaspirillum galbum TaxID=2709383 RepID=A0A6B3SIA1_9BURK|nr:hypothetical protein [Noviherbaspirillum galbum]NEX60348.1 hypothetical protein [Noviherbaspirillum galbum]